MRKILILIIFVLLPATATSGLDIPSEWQTREWFGVYLMGEKVGFGFSELTMDPEENYHLCSGFNYLVKLPGGSQKMSIEQELVFGTDKELISFHREMLSPLGPNNAKGKRAEGGFFILTESSGKFVSSPPIKLKSCLLEKFMAYEHLPEGTTREATIFDLDLGGALKIRSQVTAIKPAFPGGTPTKVWEIKTELKGLGISFDSLVDETGRTLTSQLGGALNLKAESKQQAQDLRKGWDYLNYSRIVPTQPAPANSKSISYRLSGLPKDFSCPSSQRQVILEQLGPGEIILRENSKHPVPPLPPSFPVNNSSLAAWRKSTPTIQADNPLIKKTAVAAVGRAKNSLEAMNALNLWVNKTLKKNFILAIPDALSVLEQKKGDCKGHSVLLVALARALGIPARLVAGVALAQDGNFYYHQWVEAWVGEWISFDPAFGQSIVDPGHIALFRGELPDLVGVAQILGELKITPLYPQEKN